jgi:hypothetical protein
MPSLKNKVIYGERLRTLCWVAPHMHLEGLEFVVWHSNSCAQKKAAGRFRFHYNFLCIDMVLYSEIPL